MLNKANAEAGYMQTMLNKNIMSTIGTTNNETGSHIRVLKHVFVINDQ